MHILIIPSEHFLTKSSPLAGVFQYEQALALTTRNNKVGVVSIGFITPRYLFRAYSYESTQILDGISVYRKYRRLIIPHRLHSVDFLSKKYISLFDEYFQLYVGEHGYPDVVHAHNFLYAGFIASYLKNKYSIPYVLTEHSSAFLRGMIPDSLDNKLAVIAHNASVVTCVSKALCMKVSAKLGVDVSVLHNVVDDSFFVNEHVNKNSKSFNFLNVASLDSNKNQQLILHAFAENFIGTRAFLTIVGSGPLKSELESLAEELGVWEQVEFSGYLNRHQVKLKMAAADCFVLSSIHETFGVVLIEALASGVPVIATKCGGPEDIINDCNGLLVDVNDCRAFGCAMLDFYNNSEKFNSEVLRKSTLSKFGKEIFLDSVELYYGQAVNANQKNTL